MNSERSPSATATAGATVCRARRRCPAAWGWLAALAVAVLAGGAFAGNIFDDDWTPPAPPVAKPAQPATPLPKPVTSEKPPVKPDSAPANPSAVPVDPARVPSVDTGPARLPIPAKEELAEARKLMREIFAKELADKAPAARRGLAEKLLAEAAQAASKPVDQYVLFGGAYEAAKEAASVQLTLRAADGLADTFAVDGRAMKLAALPSLAKAADPAEAKAATTAALELASAASAAGDFDAARQASDAAEQAAGKSRDVALQTRAKEAGKEVRWLADEAVRYQKDSAALKTEPSDAKANLSVGRYLCFVKEDWTAGLPLLAKGEDAALSAAAGMELTGRGDASRLAIADGWWAIASKESHATAKRHVEAHAAEQYRAALPTLVGLEKLRVEKRLEEIDAANAATAPPSAVAAGKPSPAKGAPAVAVGKLAPTGRSAEVEIDGQWEKLVDGGSLAGKMVVEKVPDRLVGTSFTRSGSKQAMTTFKVTKAGVVMMAVTDRWGGGGNSGGNWKVECVSRGDLEKQGWHEVATLPLENDKMKWIVFARDCKAGEAFTFRTEKYNAPFLVR